MCHFKAFLIYYIGKKESMHSFRIFFPLLKLLREKKIFSYLCKSLHLKLDFL